jgi:hypothetical protein
MAQSEKSGKTKRPSTRQVVNPADRNEAQEVTRHISTTTTAMLWGRAGGRCEFAGCNQTLWRSPVTQEAVNISQRAHIYSFSSDGPRGNLGIKPDELNAIENLMLVYPGCHLTWAPPTAR